MKRNNRTFGIIFKPRRVCGINCFQKIGAKTVERSGFSRDSLCLVGGSCNDNALNDTACICRRRRAFFCRGGKDKSRFKGVGGFIREFQNNFKDAVFDGNGKHKLVNVVRSAFIACYNRCMLQFDQSYAATFRPERFLGVGCSGSRGENHFIG